MARISNRSAILAAAEKVAVDAGAAQLTLDAVAAEAGVSKGGLLYHFPSKNALLEAMLDELLSGYEARCAAKMTELEEGVDRSFLAEIATGLDPPPGGNKERVGQAMLAVLANEPNLLERCRKFQAARYACCLGQDGDVRKVMLLLALDGYKLLDLLRMSPFSDQDREHIRNHLRAESARVTGKH